MKNITLAILIFSALLFGREDTVCNKGFYVQLMHIEMIRKNIDFMRIEHGAGEDQLVSDEEFDKKLKASLDGIVAYRRAVKKQDECLARRNQ